MQFKQIIGQESAKNLLLQMANNQRIPHSLLLLGNSGGAALSLAMAMAKRILCTSPTTHDACGQCSACRKAERFIHPDWHFSFPVIGTGATSDTAITEWRSAIRVNPFLDITSWLSAFDGENKQANITKDECAAILKKLSLKPFESDKKVLLMWLPEYLGKEGNRLLKLIEEPPANTYFLFVAENQERILPTVLSRCQLVHVPPYPPQDVKQCLVEQFALEPHRAEAVSYLCDGNIAEARNMAQESDVAEAAFFANWLRTCYKGTAADMVKAAETLAAYTREQQKNLMLYGLHFLRECLYFQVTGNQQLKLPQQEQGTAQRLAVLLGLTQYQQLTALMNGLYTAIERNANPKILYLDASIHMNHIFTNRAQA